MAGMPGEGQNPALHCRASNLGAGSPALPGLGRSWAALRHQGQDNLLVA